MGKAFHDGGGRTRGTALLRLHSSAVCLVLISSVVLSIAKDLVFLLFCPFSRGALKASGACSPGQGLLLNFESVICPFSGHSSLVTRHCSLMPAAPPARRGSPHLAVPARRRGARKGMWAEKSKQAPRVTNHGVEAQRSALVAPLGRMPLENTQPVGNASNNFAQFESLDMMASLDIKSANPFLVMHSSEPVRDFLFLRCVP